MAAMQLVAFIVLGVLTATVDALPHSPRWVPSLLSSASTWSPAWWRRAPAPTTCNGSASYCSRRYSNMTFIGTHDSFAISSWNVAANQDVSITTQLSAGIRMLQSQAHKSPNKTATGAGIDLCHTSCALFQGGALESYLGQVKAWTDKNPTEVLSLLIVNSDNLPATQFAKAFEASGLAAKSYRPPQANGGVLTRSQWPTLGALIQAGTSLVTFLASGADVSTVPYLLPEFVNMFENAYGQQKLPFNCTIDRIAPSSDPSKLMYVANHFKDTPLFGTPILVPDKVALSKTNARAQVLAGANSCAARYGRYPNFVLVDFFNHPKDGPIEAATILNGG